MRACGSCSPDRLSVRGIEEPLAHNRFDPWTEDECSVARSARSAQKVGEIGALGACRHTRNFLESFLRITQPSDYARAAERLDETRSIGFPAVRRPLPNRGRSMPEEQKEHVLRVAFEHPIPAQLMAIDGTWRRPGRLKDVSETGATLEVEGSMQGLALKEFFLLLSSTGLVYRRCQLDRVKGEELEVTFLRQAKGKKQAKEPSELI
jgi:hypothetical protein